MTKQPDVNCNDDILIIDNNKVSLDYLMNILKDAGYKVRAASNGPAALGIVKTGYPALIIISVMMQDMDGFEVCRHLKDDENTRHIPVIFISELNDNDIKIKGFDAGCNDFINKPFNGREILARIKMHIELRQTQINLENQNARLKEEIASYTKVQHSLEESEKRFKLMFENAPLSYQSLDTNACLIDVNKCWLSTMGYTSDEVIGHFFGDFMTPESAELIKDRFANFVATGEIHNYEFEMVQKNGTKFIVTYDGRIGYDELGHFNKTHCIFTDITERKLAESALTKLRLQIEMILNSAGEGIFGIDLDGKITFVNPAAANMIGWPADELIGKDQHKISHHSKPDGSLYPVNECKIQASFMNGKTNNVTDEVFWRKDGTNFPIEYSSTPMYDEKGRLMGAVVTFSDITERKKAVEGLRESEEAYRQISSAVSDYIFSSNIDKDGKSNIHWVAGAFERITGYKYEEYISCGGWHARLHPDDIEIDNRDMEKLRSNQKISSEVRTLKKDGSVLWVKVYANPVMNPDETELIGVKGAVQDINERKQAEIDLIEARGNAEKSKNYYEAIINNMGDPVFVKDNQKRLLLANDAFCTLFNLSRTEIIGKTLAENVAPDECENFLRVDNQVLEDGLDSINEESLTIMNGQTRTISTRKSRFMDNKGQKYVVGVIRDITDRKKNEVELMNLKNELELIVEEKTKELKERVTELERFYNATINRELRMKELRDEIELLKSGK